jgi:hypothetical protein
LSAQAAIGAAKRYLADDSYRIRLHDLYRDAVSQAKSVWMEPGLSDQGTPPSPDAVAKRIKAYDASSIMVVALNATIARWSRGEQDDLLVSTIGEIGKEPIIIGSRTQYQDWNYLQAYPAMRMLYAAGMASLAAKRPTLFSRLMTASTPTIRNKNELAVSRLVAPFQVARQHLWGLFGGSQRHVPMSDWLHDTLRGTFLSLITDDGNYDLLFDTFEYYLALAYAACGDSVTGWVPLGSWAAHRHASLPTIFAGLNGDDVGYGGKEFAGSCKAFTHNGKDLLENIKVVEGFRSQVHFF